MGFDLIQQRVLFWPEEMPRVEAVVRAIDARDATALARCLRVDGQLTLGLVDWPMLQAHEGHDMRMLEWCLGQDRVRAPISLTTDWMGRGSVSWSPHSTRRS